MISLICRGTFGSLGKMFNKQNHAETLAIFQKGSREPFLLRPKQRSFLITIYIFPETELSIESTWQVVGGMNAR